MIISHDKQYVQAMCCNIVYQIKVGDVKFCRRCQELVNTLEELEELEDERDD